MAEAMPSPKPAWIGVCDMPEAPPFLTNRSRVAMLLARYGSFRCANIIASHPSRKKREKDGAPSAVAVAARSKTKAWTKRLVGSAGGGMVASPETGRAPSLQ